MITYKQLKEKLDLKQRKAAKRRMALLAKKPSTQKKREKGKLLQWSAKKIHSKALKVVRKFAMQKAAGKDKDISKQLERNFKKNRIKIYTNSEVISVENNSIII